MTIDCRVIFCARPNCRNPVTPRGRCCPVCSNGTNNYTIALDILNGYFP